MLNFDKITEELNGRTRAELREMCEARGIKVNTKTVKNVLVEKLVSHMREHDKQSKPSSEPNKIESEVPTQSTGPLKSVNSAVTSFITPSNTFKSLIKISCGASVGNFPVVGKSVSEVCRFLREALNIDESAQPIVNGEPVGPAYILKENDTAEFIKVAGRKGNIRK